jgi:hypothetical protein
MINKRLLIKNFLTHNDECTFYDKKEAIDIKSNSGRAKLLKHICALSNSNLLNESFIIVGVSNNNTFVGVDFIDDSAIQDFVNSSLINPPIIKYENISFPNIPKNKSIGLLTIKSTGLITSFSKTIHQIKIGTIYQRVGSKSTPTIENVVSYSENEKIIQDTYKYSANSLKDMLDSTFNFYSRCDKAYNPQYIVFKEQFVLCWSGYCEVPYSSNEQFYSEVDIQLINEGTRLFYSAMNFVKISITEVEFKIDEYVYIGTDDQTQLYPFESTKIIFSDNGTYHISRRYIFTPPIFTKDKIDDLYRKTKEYEKKYLSKNFKEEDWGFFGGVAGYYLTCFFNGIDQARQDFYEAYSYLDGIYAELHVMCRRVLEEFEKNNSANCNG